MKKRYKGFVVRHLFATIRRISPDVDKTPAALCKAITHALHNNGPVNLYSSEKDAIAEVSAHATSGSDGYVVKIESNSRAFQYFLDNGATTASSIAAHDFKGEAFKLREAVRASVNEAELSRIISEMQRGVTLALDCMMPRYNLSATAAETVARRGGAGLAHRRDVVGGAHDGTVTVRPLKATGLVRAKRGAGLPTVASGAPAGVEEPLTRTSIGVYRGGRDRRPVASRAGDATRPIHKASKRYVGVAGAVAAARAAAGSAGP